MHLTQKQELILAIVIFMIAGYVLYSTFAKPGSSSVSTVTVGGVATTTQNQDIIDLANKFDQISININLFSSPLFKNLRDLEMPLSPENPGRPNPFAAIGADSSSAVQATVPVSTTTKKTTP